MTPIALQQFRIFYAPDKPIGVALWAKVAPHVEERLAQGNARLAPADWKSGNALWLVDLIAPFGGQDEMLKDLKLNVFPQETIKLLAAKEGKLALASI
jgi:cytolysin-activating lysine-acyltransferase